MQRYLKLPSNLDVNIIQFCEWSCIVQLFEFNIWNVPEKGWLNFSLSSLQSLFFSVRSIFLWVMSATIVRHSAVVGMCTVQKNEIKHRNHYGNSMGMSTSLQIWMNVLVLWRQKLESNFFAIQYATDIQQVLLLFRI